MIEARDLFFTVWGIVVTHPTMGDDEIMAMMFRRGVSRGLVRQAIDLARSMPDPSLIRKRTRTKPKPFRLEGKCPWASSIDPKPRRR